MIFGDYDCDGICATAILVRTLRAAGADVSPFVPNRLAEGYGMSDAAVARMLADNPSAALVVTVDNGISSAAQVRKLRERGIATVVTDHHLPGAELPDCTVVNPKVAAPPDLDGLCGAGVAFMVANAFVRMARAEGLCPPGSIAGPLVVLAGVATVADIMPLRGQNRILVAEALRLFRRCAPAGLRELLDRAARSGETAMTSRDFAYLLGPRINAPGRLSDGTDALALTLEDDREAAREAARRVDLLNTQRKTVEQAMSAEALQLATPGEAAYAIELPGGHRGVAGIVAARVLERLCAAGSPAPVCVTVGGRGSGRAPEGYNIRDAFAACEELLESYGGHAAAGGVGIKPGMEEAFRERFAAACRAQAAAAPGGAAGALRYDAWVDPRSLDADFVAGLSALEPFGEGNPEPVFAAGPLAVSEARRIGMDGRHLRLDFAGAAPESVWWGRGDLAEELRSKPGAKYDILFTAAVSRYGGTHVEARICAMRPSAEA